MNQQRLSAMFSVRLQSVGNRFSFFSNDQFAPSSPVRTRSDLNFKLKVAFNCVCKRVGVKCMARGATGLKPNTSVICHAYIQTLYMHVQKLTQRNHQTLTQIVACQLCRVEASAGFQSTSLRCASCEIAPTVRCCPGVQAAAGCWGRFASARQ